MTVEITTLANGFRVVSEPMPGWASAALGVWVEAGTRHERAEENGIAHFLEHMAFKGTTRRSARRIAEEIEGVGGYLNAYTSRERTAYYARVLAEHVPLALDIIGDILRDSRLDEGDIELERGVILQEIAETLDTPDELVFDWLQEVAFPGQPMGRPVLGTPGTVRAIARADLARFIATHYRPERMILAAAGAVDHGALVRLAESLFGDMAPGAAAAAEPARYGGGERRGRKALEQAHVAFGLAAPSVREEDFYAAQILATLLGGGMSSRLFQELREKRGLCYTVHAQYSAWSDAGLLTVYGGTGEEELGEFLSLALAETSRAARDVAAAEVERARAQTRAGLLMGLESASARAERLAAMLAVWGRVPPLEETIAKVEGVGVEEAREVARRMLASPVSLVLYGPVERAAAFEEVAAGLVA